MAAVQSYVLSAPPETAKKRQVHLVPVLEDEVMDVTPTKGTKTGSDGAIGEDVEMETRGSSDGWETQDSTCDEEGAGPSTSPTIISSSLEIQHRLLYRGALSLPNSAIILEGIQFVARLPGVTPPLLAAPLPLALESMRGIPTLKLLGTMKLSPDTARLDTEIDVRLHIHPQSYVTRGYFQRVLVLETHYIPERTLLRSPHPHPHIDPRITSTAVRIGLGEDVIVVYGRLQSEEYARVERGEGVGKLELVAARLLDPSSQSDSDDDSDEDMEEDLPEGTMFAVPPPRQNAPRPPRPDDPLPREPPTRAILKRTGLNRLVAGSGGLQRTVSIASGSGSGSTSGIKRTASVLGTEPSGKRSLAFGRVRSEVVVRGLGEQIDTPQAKTKPKDPASSARGKSKAKGKAKAEEGKGGAEDPFVVSSEDRGEVDPGAVLPKMMARVKSGGTTAAGSGGEEAANKALIKRLAQSALETYGIDREDAGFKEVFGYVTRGVGFAFRNKMKVESIGRDELRKMVVRHVEMYVGGNGEVSAPA